MKVMLVTAVAVLVLVLVLAYASSSSRPTQPTRPRFAVINTLGWHYECMGHVLEYMRDRGIAVDVYTVCDGNDGGWIDVYARLGLATHTIPVSSFGDRCAYEHVFAMNGVDLDAIPNDTPATCIAHTAACRFTRATRQLHLRPLPLSMADWAIPVYRMCTAEQKIAALSRRTSVALIGFSWSYHTVAQLRAIFTDFDSVDFHVIGRTVSRELGSAPNVTLHENVGTNEMMSVVMKAHYVAAPFGGVFDESQLSGCVPLAFSTGTPLIISAIQNAHMLFDSALVVSGGVVGSLRRTSPASVRAVIAERDRLSSHRDAVYAGILADAIPKVRFCTAPFERGALPSALSSILATERARSPDYEIWYYDDAARDEFVRCHFPQFLSHYRNLIPGAYQADLWRLMVLYTHGGVYADIAARFAVPLSSFVHPTDRLLMCVDTPTDPAGICNAFIAARPAHPAIRLAIERIVLTRLEPRDKGAFTLDIAGPQALGRAMRLFLYGVDDGRPFVPGDYGAYRLFDYRVPEMRDDRGAVVVSTFKFDGYYGAMYDARGVRHYYPLWHESCVYRDRSEPSCDRSGA
jgi:hypothetical protein